MSDIVDPMVSRASLSLDNGSIAIPFEVTRKIYSEQRLARALWVGFLNVAFTLLSLPTLLAVTLLLIVLNPFFNPGPLLFRQQRVGLGGRFFTIYKFRTMTEAQGDETTNIAVNEVRITRLGRVLRKFRIDELPNFANVVLGDMNVVGPRPDARPQVEIYVRTIHGYQNRFEVKPGITGLAQVKQGYAACEASTRKKARWDRYYVHNRNFGLDLFVIAQTLQVMRTGFGSR